MLLAGRLVTEHKLHGEEEEERGDGTVADHAPNGTVAEEAQQELPDARKLSLENIGRANTKRVPIGTVQKRNGG